MAPGGRDGPPPRKKKYRQVRTIRSIYPPDGDKSLRHSELIELGRGLLTRACYILASPKKTWVNGEAELAK